MAILDGKLFFAEDALVEDTGLIGDVIDTHTTSIKDVLFRGEPIWWVSLITHAPTADPPADAEFSFMMVGNSTEDVNGSGRTRVLTSGEFSVGEVRAGAYWNAVMPLTNVSTPRYIGAVADTAGDTFTGMRATSYLTITPPSFGWEKIKDWR